MRLQHIITYMYENVKCQWFAAYTDSVYNKFHCK